MFLSVALRNKLRVAFHGLSTDQRHNLIARGDELLYAGRDDFAFTIHRKEVSARLRVVVLQPELCTLGSSVNQIIQTVILQQSPEIEEIPAPGNFGGNCVEAGRFLAKEHQHLVRVLLERMPARAKVWLEQRGRSIVILGDTKAVYGVSLPNLPSPCDIIVINSIGLGLRTESALALLAHELGHVFHRDDQGEPTPHGIQGEIDADANAAAWGFREGLREHLASEILTTANSRLRVQLEARAKALK